MDFCYVFTKLLDDGDTADNGQGLHLALGNVNDAEDHENQGSKAASPDTIPPMKPINGIKERIPPAMPITISAMEQNQSLISVELCRTGSCLLQVRLSTEYRCSLRIPNTLSLRVHIYYLLKYTSRSRWRHKPTTKISHGLHISYNKMRLLSTKSVKSNVNYTKKLKSPVCSQEYR